MAKIMISLPVAVILDVYADAVFIRTFPGGCRTLVLYAAGAEGAAAQLAICSPTTLILDVDASAPLCGTLLGGRSAYVLYATSAVSIIA